MKIVRFLYLLFALTVLLGSNLYAQDYPQPFPDPRDQDPPDDWLLEIFLNNSFRIGGVETGISTYGCQVGLPVLWAGDQLKIVPTLGWFWDTPNGWGAEAALGGRVLYYLSKQEDLERGNMNPYAGGFSLMQGSGLHNSGIAIGFEPRISKYFKLGFEIQAGLRSRHEEDKAFGGAAITIGLGW